MNRNQSSTQSTQLNNMCSMCDENAATEDDLCKSCYDMEHSNLSRLSICPVCNSHRRGTFCLVCAIDNAPSEESTYEEILEWEEKQNNIPDEMQTAIRISLIESLPTRKCTPSDESCSICLSEYETNDYVMTLPCMHSFHTTCCSSWLMKKTSCPHCLRDVIQY